MRKRDVRAFKNEMTNPNWLHVLGGGVLLVNSLVLSISQLQRSLH